MKMCSASDGCGVTRHLLTLAVLTLLIATGIASGSCTLQVHGYDRDGNGWGESTVRITNGDIVLLEDWAMTDGYYDMVEFYFEGDQLDLELYLLRSEQTGYGDIIISNDLGKPLFHEDLKYWIFSHTEEYSYPMHCSQTNETLISRYGYAKPDLEPECYDGYEDIFNGGCNSTTQMFTEIQCGETILGSIGKFRKDDLIVLEEDWYLLTLPYETVIGISGFCESPLRIEVLEHDDCENIEVRLTMEQQLCDIHFWGVSLPAGQHAIRVMPELPWAFPCDSGLEYALSVSCFGGFSESSCSTEEEPECSMDFDEAVNDLCESAEDTVSNLIPSCINSGTTGYYMKDGSITADVDYFSFHIWEGQDIPLIVESMCPLTVALFYGDCADHTLLDSVSISPLISNTIQFDPLLPGDYLLRVETEVDSGVSCGSAYKLLLDAGIYGNNCNTADQLDPEDFYDTNRNIHTQGDTTFANNFYTAAEYGCSDNLDTPETVHQLIVDERMTISVTLEAEEWEPRLVVTRAWPPLDCLNSEYNPEDPMTASIPHLILEPDTPYFFFVEGAIGQCGHYALKIEWIDPVSNKLTVDLNLNKERYFTGDPVVLTGKCENHTLQNIAFNIALILEIEGTYWFYHYGDWSSSMEMLPHYTLRKEGTVEWRFINSIWPESPFMNIPAMFTFFLLDYDSDSNPYLKSNIVTEEFIF
ncbi:hypothetical protein K8T06_06140 [bacterium]|nr:hypothetical protein [bacterium]